MKKLVEKFRLNLINQRLSENTIKSYMISVNTYYNIYGSKINQENITQYQEYLQARYKPKSINLRIIAFNRFLSFAGYSDFRLRLVKYQQKSYLDNVISYADYLKFKGFLKMEKDKKWFYIVWTLAATGVRISELKCFRVEHIFAGQLDVKSKGEKLRRIYIPQTLQTALIEWLTDNARMSGQLFLNTHGNPISIRGISKGLEKRAVRYGFDKHLVHPHAFRHLFAKKFLETKNDLSMLADLLGHESLDTTKIYLRMTSQEQRDIINQVVEW